MYVPKPYRIDDLSTLHAFMDRHAFATLVSTIDGVPFATHLPLLVDRDGEYGTLRGHVARANPHWEHLGDAPSLAMFAGPHAYVSPSWYVTVPSVPTWNYTAVHVTGHARIVDDPAVVSDILRRSIEAEEVAFAQPWEMTSLSDDYLAAMTRAIVAFEMPINQIQGKYKLSQNRIPDDRKRVAHALSGSPDPAARAAGALMHSLEAEPIG